MTGRGDASRQVIRCVAILAMVVGAAALTPPATAVPPPPERPVVDCAQPIYAVDTLVCEDAELRTANDRLRRLLAVDPPGIDGRQPAGAWIESQSDWYRRRALCAFRKDAAACVTDAYAERITVLAALRDPPADAGRETRCRNVPWAGKTRIERQAGGLVLREPGGPVQAVALPQRASGWTPFVTLKRDDSARLELQGPSGAARCSPLAGNSRAKPAER